MKFIMITAIGTVIAFIMTGIVALSAIAVYAAEREDLFFRDKDISYLHVCGKSDIIHNKSRLSSVQGNTAQR